LNEITNLEIENKLRSVSLSLHLFLSQLNLNHCFLKIVRKSSDSDESLNQLIKSPTKSRIFFLKNDSSTPSSSKTENIQITVQTTDNQVKKESSSDTKLVKKPIRRKVYLN
jgi:hypothetical protein